MVTKPLMIGVSPRLRQHAPAEMGLHDKSFQHIEQSVSQWIQSNGALCLLLPAPAPSDDPRRVTVNATDYAQALDGLVLQGGKDLDPALYGQPPRFIIGEPDVIRDRFELDLVRAFSARGKPVLGICRGMQLINVAFGGTLHQDLEKEGVCGVAHVVRGAYDNHHHAVRMPAGGVLSSWYEGATEGQVNSIHHQGVAGLASGFEVAATAPDGVIEAIWRNSESFVLGVQWHPEFQDGRDPSLLPADPLMKAFLAAAERGRDTETASG